MHRDRYIEVLELLADHEAQAEYERNVPIADVPAELLSMWFDDLSLSRHCLSDEDASIIRLFTDFYQARAAKLPTLGGVAALHRCREWHEIAEEAAKTLHELRSRSI